MDRGAWWTIVHGDVELDTTERVCTQAHTHTHTHTHTVLYLSNTPNSSLNMRTSDPQRATFYKISDQYSFTRSRPSGTRKI